MKSWWFYAGVTHGTSSSLQAGTPATGTQAISQPAAANSNKPGLSSRANGRPAASCPAQRQVPAASLSVSSAVAQQADGVSIHLADKPVLGPAAMQLQRQQALKACSRHDVPTAAASGADLHEVTDASLCCEPGAAAAAASETLGGSHSSGGCGVMELSKAGDAVARAASPPFFFEGDAGEDSLIDMGEVWEACAVSQNTLSRCQENTAGSVLEAGSTRQQAAAAVPEHHRAVNTVGQHSGLSTQTPSERQQLGASSTAAAACQVEGQGNALQDLQAASNQQTQAVAHNAAAAMGPQPVLRKAPGKLHTRQAGALLDTAAAVRLVKATAAGPKAGVMGSTVSGNSESKENEDVSMAQVVRQVRNGHSRLDKQTVVQPVKPTMSSKVRDHDVSCALGTHACACG